MNIGGLVRALLPLFFVLALGYVAGNYLRPSACDVSYPGFRHRSAPAAGGRHSSRDFEPRDRCGFCGIAFPSSAGPCRTKIRSEVPIALGPVLGIAVVLAGLRIPKDRASCFEMNTGRYS